MFYQGKVTAPDSRYGTWLTSWFDNPLTAVSEANKLNLDNYQGLGAIKILESPERLPELAGPFGHKYYKYRYFTTDLKTGKNKEFVMDSEVYDESLEGLWDYRSRVESEHQDNITGLMHAYCNVASIGYEIVKC